MFFRPHRNFLDFFPQSGNLVLVFALSFVIELFTGVLRLFLDHRVSCSFFTLNLCFTCLTLNFWLNGQLDGFRSKDKMLSASVLFIGMSNDLWFQASKC
jgi:hypothetical protein